jgi:hypothetical protein
MERIIIAFLYSFCVYITAPAGNKYVFTKDRLNWKSYENRQRTAIWLLRFAGALRAACW